MDIEDQESRKRTPGDPGGKVRLLVDVQPDPGVVLQRAGQRRLGQGAIQGSAGLRPGHPENDEQRRPPALRLGPRRLELPGEAGRPGASLGPRRRRLLRSMAEELGRFHRAYEEERGSEDAR